LRLQNFSSGSGSCNRSQCCTYFRKTGSYNAAAVSTAFGSGANNNNDSFVTTLTNLFINGANELAVAAFNSTTLASYFTAVTSIGAVKNADDKWYAGWTCNSSTADFGTGNSGACTSIPTK
jgi:hypothetical protein